MEDRPEAIAAALAGYSAFLWLLSGIDLMMHLYVVIRLVHRALSKILVNALWPSSSSCWDGATRQAHDDWADARYLVRFAYF